MLTLTQQGINALKLGNRVESQTLLKQAINQNSQDVQAWLWLSSAVENNQERLRCLQKVLTIDPDNTAAAKGLAKLVTSGVVQVQTPNMETPLQAADKRNNIAPQNQNAGSERILFKVKPSIVPFIIVLILSSILLVGMVGVFAKVSNSSALNLILGFFGLIMFGWVYWKIGISFLKSLFTRYILTTKHLIVKTGVLSRSQKTIPIKKIQDVSFHQVFLFRPFGIGNVIVESAGELGEIKLFALTDCQERAKQILHVVER